MTLICWKATGKERAGDMMCLKFESQVVLVLSLVLVVTFKGPLFTVIDVPVIKPFLGQSYLKEL